ncbi:MAG: glycosyltransferase family 9 protein [Fimbriimonadaceae bacterium]|nr:glycosyltransferase family 9 protein [Fimbriimonadaceae bacterium]
MRVLISRLSSMGDVVLTLPTACALKDSGVAKEVIWVCDRRFAAIPRLCDSVDEVVEWTRDKATDRRHWRSLGQFDVALDMQGLLKSGLVTGLADAKSRFGYHWQREGARLFSAPIRPDPTSFHIADQLVDVARFLGAEVANARFGLAPTQEDTARVRDLVVREGGAPGRWIAVNPGAGWPTKRWHPHSVASLCDQISSAGWVPILIGGPDVADVRDIVGQSAQKSFVDLVGKTSISELVALIDSCDAHVGGDTGSTHMAAALGKVAIGIYTVSDPRRVCPYGQIENVLRGQPSPQKVWELLTARLTP